MCCSSIDEQQQKKLINYIYILVFVDSEAYIVDCAPGKACSGGWYGNAWYLVSYDGQFTSASYPYTGKAVDCKAMHLNRKTDIGAKISKKSIEYEKVIKRGDVNTMMTLLSQNRLLSALFAVGPNFFYYK